MIDADRIKGFMADMRRQGFHPDTVVPPGWRVLWLLGFPVPPPHFVGFMPLVFIFGSGSGTWLFLAMEALWICFHGSLREAWPLDWKIGLLCVAGGVCIGVMMGAYYRHTARRLRLPRWADYRPRETSSGQV